jgi:hypothetical protein
MRSTIIVLLAGVSYAPMSADARCYTIWRYPEPQDCGTHYHVHTRTMAILLPSPPLPPVNPVSGIPLPDMNATWGGAMDTELELSLQRQKAIRQLTLESK